MKKTFSGKVNEGNKTKKYFGPISKQVTEGDEIKLLTYF